MSARTPRLESDPAWIAAKAAGQTRYHGRPCRKGHDGERYVTGAICVHCAAKRAQEFRDRNAKIKPAGAIRPVGECAFASAHPAARPNERSDPPSLLESIIAPPSRDRLMARR